VLAAQFTDEAWPLALALHSLIAGAVTDVHVVACAAHSRRAQRTADFLRLWYGEQQTVSSIAASKHLSRSHVAKAIHRLALLMIAEHFLECAWVCLSALRRHMG
jgi:hypothetical protein